ncbi:MAG TPA: glycosyltransferase family 39 protein [Flavobacterium sp.]
MKILNWVKNNVLLVTILVVGTFLRFYKADFQSLWLDEILSMNDANPELTWTQFYDGIMFWEFIPHLYFALLRVVFEVFGFTSLVARLFSACIGVVGIYAIYLLARELFSRKAGLIAAALLAVNIFHISYSQEVRPYGMLFLFTVLAFYRLIIFLRNITIRNAVYYGIFAGLIINAHFFGFITLFSQALLLLFFLVKADNDSRINFFLHALFAGFIILLVAFPAYDAIIRVSEIQSFWLQKPGPDAYTKMFMEFFGNSEMVLFVIHFAVVYYIVRLFSHESSLKSYTSIVNDRLVSGALFLLVWIAVSLAIPLIRSYLDVPMILSRYFINILPAIIIVIAIGIATIKNGTVKVAVLSALLLFSVIDIFVVNNYYNTVKKAQFRELTQEIIKRNPDKAKVFAFWGWIFPHYFSNTQTVVENRSFEDLLADFKSGSRPLQPFWYADANSRPFALTAADQEYLNTNFDLEENLEYYDAWARYYVPRNTPALSVTDKIDLSWFKPGTIDGSGNLVFYENTNAKTPFMKLRKGNYKMIIRGSSLPAEPIDGQNAHVKVKINGNLIGDFYMSEKVASPPVELAFQVIDDQKVRVQIIYDNDFFKGKMDRNLIISSIQLKADTF